MIRTIPTIRDFLDDEQMKHLPGNLKVENCMLLVQNKVDKENTYKTVIQVFDRSGTWMGEISNPDFIPNDK